LLDDFGPAVSPDSKKLLDLFDLRSAFDLALAGKKVERTSAVIERWVQEYLEATGVLNDLNEAAGV